MKIGRLEILIISSVFLFAGCASVFGPSQTKIQAVPWKSFDKSVLAYNMIKESGSTLEQTEILGFDPEKISGSEEWDEITTRNYLMGSNVNARIDDLPAGAQLCLKTKNGCRTRVFKIDLTKTQAEGNYLIKEEILGIEEQRRTTGSRLEVKLFYDVKSGVILFKTKQETPFVNELSIKKDPLGTAKKLFGIGQKFFCPFC